MRVKVNKVKIILQVIDIVQVHDVDVLVRVSSPDLFVPDEWLSKLDENALNQLSKIGWCDVGSAVMTPLVKSEYRAVIHAIGPRWGEESARGKLANVTWELLWLAETGGFRSLALPAISVGTLGYPVENCARTMLQQVLDFTFEPIRHIRTIVFCLLSTNEYHVFEAELRQQIDALDSASTQNA